MIDFGKYPKEVLEQYIRESFQAASDEAKVVSALDRLHYKAQWNIINSQIDKLLVDASNTTGPEWLRIHDQITVLMQKQMVLQAQMFPGSQL